MNVKKKLSPIPIIPVILKSNGYLDEKEGILVYIRPNIQTRFQYSKKKYKDIQTHEEKNEKFLEILDELDYEEKRNEILSFHQTQTQTQTQIEEEEKPLSLNLPIDMISSELNSQNIDFDSSTSQSSLIPLSIISLSSIDSKQKKIKLNQHLQEKNQQDRRSNLINEIEALRKNPNSLKEKLQQVIHNKEDAITKKNILLAQNSWILWQKHLTWIKEHNLKLEKAFERKLKQEDRNKLLILESLRSTQILRRQELKEKNEKQRHQKAFLPLIFYALITIQFQRRLEEEWKQKAKRHKIMKWISHWKNFSLREKERKKSSLHLIHWLREEIPLKRIWKNVLEAYHIYLKKVKSIQSLWRRKVARIIALKFIVNKVFCQLEKEILLDNLKLAGKKKKKPKNTKTKKHIEKVRRIDKRNAVLIDISLLVLHKVSDQSRNFILNAYIEEKEKKRIEETRNYIEGIWPHLLQILYIEYPEKSSYQIKQFALKLKALGKIYSTLSNIPGALEGIDSPPFFYPSRKDIEILIKKGRDLDAHNDLKGESIESLLSHEEENLSHDIQTIQLSKDQE